ncbi:hypothetical protein CERSUDRAFT_116656 [Gelatoporia subvermispora B]|uniref:C2 domain-containing protein n=1 Tax=Ceriporiopsis subvermispora (strain B) TaxID=914234 RepID=M2QDR6_CERS8|nr:hypothetical protein CERSUDRAFT_116656 [Gelatoporia subvermispora B]
MPTEGHSKVKVRLKVEEVKIKSSLRSITKLLGKSRAEVVIEVNGVKEAATKVSTPGEKATWNEELYIHIEETDKVVVRVFDHAKEKSGGAILVGDAEVDLSFVHSSSVTSKYLIFDVKKSNKSSGRVNIEVTRIVESQGQALTQSENDSTEPEDTIENLVQRAEAKVAAEPSYERFKDVLSYMNVVIKVAEPLSDLGVPGLKTTHDILSKVYEVLHAQKERDENVGKLAKEMAQLWTILSEIKNLEMIKTMKDVMEASTEQTKKCAEFLEKYADTNIAKRFFTGYFVTDERISAFQDSFHDLRERMTRGASIQTWVVVERGFSDLTARMDLQGLSEARSASFNSGRICLTGTRQGDLQRILKWVEDGSGSGVYWLTGVAGCGKSTIAHTVAKILEDSHRLGASFFFDRNDASLNSPRLFCTTITSQLARYDSALRKAVLDVIKMDPGIDAKPLPNQMTPLITDTTGKVRFTVPLVLIFDALDESGTPETRKEFMLALKAELPKLSSHVKILMTSRDEFDIRGALPLEASRTPHRADVKDETLADVRRFIQAQLSEVSLRFPDLVNWPTPEDIDRLATRADGLFIWANIACNFVLNGPDQDPLVHLETILSIDPAERARAESSLDTLYLTILRRNPTNMDNFRYIVGSIISLRDPLTPKDIDKLLGLVAKNAQTPLILGDGTKIRLTTCYGQAMSLASVLSVDGTEKPIRVIHASIFDFFANSERSQEFHVDLQRVHSLLTDRCFLRMRTLLRFDICGLRDPSKHNAEFSDISSRLDQRIPGDLKYACRFWAHHLTQVQSCSTKTISAVTDFLSKQFLNWLEAMSLLGLTTDICPILQDVYKWAKGLNLGDLTLLCQDCFRFAQQFRPILDVSALQIYISGMTFCPRGSRVFKIFGNRKATPMPTLTIGEEALIAPVCSTHFRHTKEVYSVKFFPQQEKIVSGGVDRTIQIWDPTSGSLLQEPLTGHGAAVLVLAISSDGGLIASGSTNKTMRIWNSSTGQPLGESLTLPEYPIGLAFMSYDTRVVSCSQDGSICIYDIEAESLTQERVIGSGGQVNCIAISSDGEQLACASTISTEIWDLVNWNTVGDPLRAASAVAFSPDNKRLAMGIPAGCDMVVTDLSTRETIELQGHEYPITAVAFSSDGSLLASASGENIIILWNGTSGAILGVLRGHSNMILSLAFSSDNSLLASGSSDRSVRIWDVNTAITSVPAQMRTTTPHIAFLVYSPESDHIAFAIDNIVYITFPDSPIMVLRKHEQEISSLAFSPNGARLAAVYPEFIQWWDVQSSSALDIVQLKPASMSGYIMMSASGNRIAAMDSTLQFWDATNGEAVGDPQTAHGDIISCMSFSRDGLLLATGSNDMTVRLWDTADASVSGEPFHNNYPPSEVSFSPDSTMLVSGAVDGTIRLWSISRRELIWQNPGDITTFIPSIVFTPDTKRIICTVVDGNIIVLDASSGASVGTPIRRFNNNAGQVSLSHDGDNLVLATDGVQVWRKGKDDTWVFKQEIWYPPEPLSSEELRFSPPFLASMRESGKYSGWLTSEEGHKLLWIPEHLRRVWPPFESARLQLGRDSPSVTLNMHEYLVWLSGITGAQYEVNQDWSYTPISHESFANSDNHVEETVQ